MKLFKFHINLALLSVLMACQSDRSKAIDNFEEYFEEFHNAYPADQGIYMFKDYSELTPIVAENESYKFMLTTTVVRTDHKGDTTETEKTVFLDENLDIIFF